MKLEELKAILKEEKEKMEFEKTVKKVYSKPRVNYNKLTKQVKKAEHLKSGSLDLNRPENMYYSDKDTARFLEGTSYMDAYNANKMADGDY